jgi:hypothetical protein
VLQGAGYLRHIWIGLQDGLGIRFPPQISQSQVLENFLWKQLLAAVVPRQSLANVLTRHFSKDSFLSDLIEFFFLSKRLNATFEMQYDHYIHSSGYPL